MTPPGRGAVASLRIWGPHATEAVAACFEPLGRRGKPGDCAPGRIVLGRWATSGEEVVCCRLSEEEIEVHCHGGDVAAEVIVESLVAQGCRELPWEEWLVHEERDEIAAEARFALAHARTERAAAVLLEQHAGALRAEIEQVLELLAPGTDHQRQEALDRLTRLLARARLGLHLVEPWRVVLAGPPNAGKSSLINALVGYQRAIVFDQPGTTRDVVTATTAIDGWPVELADTAGLRETADALESAGVAQARRQLAEADAVVLVFDRSLPWTAEDGALVASWPDALVVHNKADLPAGPGARPPGLCASALTGEGLQRLVQSLARVLVPEPPAKLAAVPFTARQVGLLEEALAAVREGRAAIGQSLLEQMLGRGEASGEREP